MKEIKSSLDFIMPLLNQGVRLLGGLYMVRLLMESFGSECYGLIMLGIAVCAYSSVLEACLAPVIKNKLILFNTNNKRKKVKLLESVVYSAIVLISLLTLILIIIAFFLNGNDLNVLRYSLVCAIAVTVSASSLISDVVYAGKNILWRIRSAEFFGLIFGYGGAAYFAVHNPNEIVVFLFLTTFSNLMKLIVWFYDVTQSRFGGKAALGLLMRFWVKNKEDTLNFFVLQLALAVTSSYPVIVISSHLGLVEVATWVNTQKVIGLPLVFYAVLMAVLWPKLAAVFAVGDIERCKSIYLYGLMLTVILFFIWLIFVIFYRSELFEWLTAGDAPSVKLMIISGSWVIISACASLSSTMLNANGMFQDQMKYSLIYLVSVLLTSSVALSYMELDGMALALLFCTIIFNLVPLVQTVYLKIFKRMVIHE